MSRKNVWWVLFFALAGVAELRVTFLRVMAADPYSAGDWLINYSGGFVRRGLPGEAILWASRWLHADLLWVVFALQAACLLVYLGFACRLALRSRGFAVAAMILSPAAVTFEALNPAEGVRKELLFFALLAVICEAGFVERMRWWVLSAGVAVVCVGLVLSHESLVAYLPYVFAAVWVRRGGEAWRIAIAPGIASAVVGFAVITHPGNATAAEAICRSVGGVYAGFGPGVCGGSIAWLAVSLGQAHRQTVEMASAHHFATVYALLAALALAPPVVAGWRRPMIWRCAVVAGVGSVGLFWSGVDWGRWIHIHLVCLMLVLLARPLREAIRAGNWSGVGGVAVAAYASCWILPVTIMSAAWPKFGLAGVIAALWR
jgi:hypothetical protein